MAIPQEIDHGVLSLPQKSAASIHYSLVNSNAAKHQLVLFLNGLMADKASWLAAMAGLIRSCKTTGFPHMLAYDRYGQGLTEDRDPQDRGREEGHGHDVADAVNDLHQIILEITKNILPIPLKSLQVIFVANSIGCAIARLYAQTYPGTVAALLMLDSIMANSNFDLWPDPDFSDFREGDLPADVSVDLLREQRAKFLAIFGPQVANREGLSRRNLAQLLPDSDGPKLVGPDGKGPLLTVAGHDFETFAQESLRVSDFTPPVL